MPSRRTQGVHAPGSPSNAKALAWRLAEPGPWRSVIAVTRGGLVPAAIVAAGEPRELQLPPRSVAPKPAAMAQPKQPEPEQKEEQAGDEEA